MLPNLLRAAGAARLWCEQVLMTLENLYSENPGCSFTLTQEAKV